MIKTILMDQNIKKHRRLELFLNRIEFKKIKTGGLLAGTLEYNYYNWLKFSFVRSLFVLIKHSLTILYSKVPEPRNTKFIFTKMGNAYNFSELMNPLIIHFLNKSTIFCHEQSFDPKLLTDYPIDSRSINHGQSNSNKRTDAGRILITTLKVIWLLLSNKKRLRISFNELICFVNVLFFQFRRVSFWDNYFEKSVEKPGCIITECDRSTIASPLILSGRKHNILTITLTHGVILEYGFTPLLADYIFCWGKYQKRQLMDQGVAPHRIVITGNPTIKVYNRDIPENLCVPNIITACLAISAEGDTVNIPLIELFVQTVELTDNTTGLIKLHPALKKEDCKWINSLSSKVIILDSTEINNSELFKKIDLLIVHYSGIANEALAAGVPVILLEPAGTSNLNVLQSELNQNAGCKMATNKEELFEIFEELIADPGQFRMESINKSKKYLEDLFEFIGEESVRAMVAEIERISMEN